VIFFYDFLNFDFRDVTFLFIYLFVFIFFFENFNIGVFRRQDHDFKSLFLKLSIIAMLAGSFSHLNGHDVTSRFARPKNTLKNSYKIIVSS
jgi:hypothetical protein